LAPFRRRKFADFKSGAEIAVIKEPFQQAVVSAGSRTKKFEGQDWK